MVGRVARVAGVVLVLVALSVFTLGYRFYNGGEDYGQAEQAPDDATARSTRYGKVVGFLDDNGTHTWMGIPYAAPPLAELRWKAPRPPARWDGSLPALQAASFCKQYGSQMESRPPREWGKPIGSEDCLYLNLFAPAFRPGEVPRGDRRLPVMVYIHGGGNMVGYASQTKYSGKSLARRYDVIVVTFNYRLGPFG